MMWIMTEIAFIARDSIWQIRKLLRRCGSHLGYSAIHTFSQVHTTYFHPRLVLGLASSF